MNVTSVASVSDTNSKFDAQTLAASADAAFTLQEMSEAWARAEHPLDVEQYRTTYAPHLRIMTRSLHDPEAPHGRERVDLCAFSF